MPSISVRLISGGGGGSMSWPVRGNRRRGDRLRLVDVLKDGCEQLLAEARPVGVVGLLTLAAPADPVGQLFEHDSVADEQLDQVGLSGRDSNRDAHQIALALQR